MHSTIQQILTSTKSRIQARSEKPLGAFRQRDFLSTVAAAKASGLVPVIAEVKPASPGKVFREISPETATGFAREMEEAGAVGISVLTEPEIFRGSLENLEAVRNTVSLPVLRKDFVIDSRQFSETGSDLILLIAGILDEKLGEFVEEALSKGFEPLVEVHNRAELECALKTAARVIGINNRNLETLNIDLKTTEELAPVVRAHDEKTGTNHLIVSESGIHTSEDIRRVLLAGADAVLVGSSIMESESVFEKTKELVQGLAWRW